MWEIRRSLDSRVQRSSRFGKEPAAAAHTWWTVPSLSRSEPMRITILCYGTRGDVQPFVALALGLQAAGHDVVLAAPTNFAEFVRGFGLTYAPLHGDSEQLLRSPEGQAWLAAGNFRALLRRMTFLMEEYRPGLCADIATACAGTDLIVATVVTMPYGFSVAEKLGVPLVLAYTFPIFPPNSDFPHIFFRSRPFPLPILNRLTHTLVNRAYWHGARHGMNVWRRELGLAPFSKSPLILAAKRKIPTLQAYSSRIVPRPTDWDPCHTVTGPFILPSGIRPTPTVAEAPDGLAAWLAAGPPPIYFGFGSMPVVDPMALLDMATTLTQQLGIRAVVGAGWTGLEVGGSGDVHVVADVDHEWLFPRCATIVHHGGAGTTAAAVRAGVPSVVCSVFADQPFWGERLVDLEVGFHFPFKDLTRSRLARALQSVSGTGMRARASALGVLTRKEEGVASAVKAIDKVFEARE